jgi:nucleotide-binding universal stress UspA family protein
MFRHLLVPTDGSDLAKATVARAVEIAQDTGARITFFHAQDSPYAHPEVSLFGEGVVIDPEMGEQFAQAHAAHAEHLLSEAKRQAEAAGVPADTLTTINPTIYEAILAAAQERDCDLIVMASHGRRGLAALLLGSETQRVLTHAAIPVLVIPATAPRSPSAPTKA